MEADTHITPLRSAPLASQRAIAGNAQGTNISATAKTAQSSVVKTIREEMLITPELKYGTVLAAGVKATGQDAPPAEAAADVEAALELPVNDDKKDDKHAEVSSCHTICSETCEFWHRICLALMILCGWVHC